MLLPVDSQPRLIKRVGLMMRLGSEVEVAYQIRDYFKKNHLPAGCRVTPLVKVEHGHYIKRIATTIRSYLILRKGRTRHDVIYSFSTDLMILAMFLSGNQRWYEIGDLRRVNSIFYHMGFKYLLQKQDVIIVTSAKFSEHIQLNYGISADRIVVIENKLDSALFSGREDAAAFRAVASPKGALPIRIGIIGLLRYEQVLAFLEAMKHETYNYEIHIHGSGPLLNRVLSYVDNSKVFYHGEFEYPNDLGRIYENLHYSFVMYDSNELNVRLALPNKLYESIYFRKPLIVSSETYLAEEVQRHGVGLAWDANNLSNLPAELLRFFENGMYDDFVSNCQKVSSTEVLASEDELFRKLTNKL